MGLRDVVERLAPGRRGNGTVRAVWNGEVLAESDRTIELEGNHYFPPESVRSNTLEPSDRTSICPWKGRASYRTVVAGGERKADAAWVYENPSAAARRIKDHVAFGRGVQVERS